MSNELVREALHPDAGNLVLVSKVGALGDEQGRWLSGQRPGQPRSAVDDNLRTLGAARLGAVNLRLMEEHGQPVEVQLEDQLAEMVAVREEGRIAGVGISISPNSNRGRNHSSSPMVRPRLIETGRRDGPSTFGGSRPR